MNPLDSEISNKLEELGKNFCHWVFSKDIRTEVELQPSRFFSTEEIGYAAVNGKGETINLRQGY